MVGLNRYNKTCSSSYFLTLLLVYRVIKCFLSPSLLSWRKLKLLGSQLRDQVSHANMFGNMRQQKLHSVRRIKGTLID